MLRPLLAALCLFALTLSVSSGGAVQDNLLDAGGSGVLRTTFTRFLSLATAGDPDTQNLLGYMLFRGEGVARDHRAAHRWFHLAAEQGHRMAQRNLGLLHSGSMQGTPDELHDPLEANFWLNAYRLLDPFGKVLSEQQQRFITMIGEEVSEVQLSPEEAYLHDCAGCHGLQGEGGYRSVPPLIAETPAEQLQRLLAKHEGRVDHLMLFGRQQLVAIFDSLSLFDKDKRLYDNNSTTGIDRGDSDPPPVQGGGEIFKTFCSGCHGLNGISYYINSPSFALGERMQKSDFELKRSIGNGLGVMPSWGAMLSPIQIDSLVAFIRTLEARYDGSIDTVSVSVPGVYFRFRPLGEMGVEWRGADPRGILPPGAR